MTAREPLPLRCPYCGGQVEVEMGTRGRGYMAEEFAEAIGCENWECAATWSPKTGAAIMLPRGGAA